MINYNIKFKKSFIKTVVYTVLVVMVILNCKSKTNATKVTSHTTTLDTIGVKYTYWWPQTGPFIGNCGEKYAFVFLGTVIDLKENVEKENYISKKGIIQVDSVLIAQQRELENISKTTCISSDCFYDVNAKKGEQVLVFCYYYDNELVTSGGKSILTIQGSKDPKVKSIQKYINANQNPLIIEADINIWDMVGLKSELEQIIFCKKMLLNYK